MIPAPVAAVKNIKNVAVLTNEKPPNQEVFCLGKKNFS